MRITINIEHNHADFLLELLKSLEYVTIETEEEDIPEWHKEMLKERIKAYEENPQDVIEWAEVKKKLHKSLL
jgi:thiamine pyrophosphate-dependent acetolactate synthase large subunit-like protein